MENFHDPLLAEIILWKSTILIITRTSQAREIIKLMLSEPDIPEPSLIEVELTTENLKKA